ncbi:MAG: hypothetical protein J3K34DRAFT_37977 [Monoraphidium minutum]|nr:MAG: hypothetical protein J3K34DRAFT_37977 [Monoraphidium minutum]
MAQPAFVGSRGLCCPAHTPRPPLTPFPAAPSRALRAPRSQSTRAPKPAPHFPRAIRVWTAACSRTRLRAAALSAEWAPPPFFRRVLPFRSLRTLCVRVFTYGRDSCACLSAARAPAPSPAHRPRRGPRRAAARRRMHGQRRAARARARGRGGRQRGMRAAAHWRHSQHCGLRPSQPDRVRSEPAQSRQAHAANC